MKTIQICLATHGFKAGDLVVIERRLWVVDTARPAMMTVRRAPWYRVAWYTTRLFVRSVAGAIWEHAYLGGKKL